MNYFLAFITGVFVILTIIFNGNLNRLIGYKQTTLINFIFGLIFSILAYLVLGLNESISLNSIPVHLYFGGMIGVLVVIISSTVVRRISAVYTTIIIFIGQILTGIIIDYFKFGVADKGNIIGSILIIIGLGINIYIDNKKLTA